MPRPHRAHARIGRERALAARQPAPHRLPPSRCAARLQHGRAPAPPTITSGRCSPMPSAPHQALACTLAGVAAPTGAAGSALFSSMAAPFQGWWRSPPGPPVEKVNLPPLTAPVSGFPVGLELERQRVPGGSGAVEVVQPAAVVRPWLPFVAAGLSQARRAGSGWRRSPEGDDGLVEAQRDLPHLRHLPRGVIAVTLAACRRSQHPQPPRPRVLRIPRSASCPILSGCRGSPRRSGRTVQTFSAVPAVPAIRARSWSGCRAGSVTITETSMKSEVAWPRALAGAQASITPADRRAM